MPSKPERTHPVQREHDGRNRAGAPAQRQQQRSGAARALALPARALGNRMYAQLQRASGAGGDAGHGAVGSVLQRSGRALSGHERSFFEPRFGRSLDAVRIHEGSGAAAAALSVGARAFTVGPDVVMGAGEYNPYAAAGRRLLAHELTHTIQQGAVRDSAAHGTHTAPRLQRIRLTNGQFGRALERYQQAMPIPDRPFNMIWRSATYRGMVTTLDRHYVDLQDSRLPTWYEIGNDGRLVNDPALNGRWAGSNRRVIYIWTSGVVGGSSFEPAMRPEDGYDTMWLNDMFYWNQNVPPQNRVEQDGSFIEVLAHETAHAHNLVTGTGRPALPPNPTTAQSIAASVQEEAFTRGREARVLGEVTPGGGLRGFTPSAGSTVPREVERSRISGEPRSTYLEKFFFDIRIREARQLITDVEAARLERIVRGIPLNPANVDQFVDRHAMILFFNPDIGIYDIVTAPYGKWLFWRRVIDERWRVFDQRPNITDAERELVLQEHAAAFFDGGIGYTP